VSVNWKFIENWSAFASYGYGFRSGGFNSTGSNATIQQYLGGLKYVKPDGTVTGTPSLVTQGIDYDDYRKEVSKAAEIGVKADLLDHTLALDLAAYHTKVDNMQVFNFLVGPFGLLRTVMNIDGATLQGVEGSVRWKANRYLSLFGGFGYIDSKIDSFASRPYTVGNKVPYAPDYTADAGVDLTVPLSSGYAVFGRVDATSIGRTWFSPVQNNQVQTEFGVPGDYSKTSRDPYTIVNARLGLSADHWNVVGWIRNLADKQYLAEVIPAPEFGGSFVHSATGRAFGVDVSYNF
jgi:iron complex outermembrane receptor protein